MNRFWESFIEPALEIRQPRILVEIGAEAGKATENLLNCGIAGRSGALQMREAALCLSV